MFAAALCPVQVGAQELEPRTYSNTPVGLNFLAVGYGFSTGNVLLDPSLPIEDAEADVHFAFVRYTRTIDLFGASSKARVLFPLSSGHWQGFLDEVFRERDANGAGDLRMSLDVNFFGAPALPPAEFSGYRQRTIVGAGVLVIAPTGTYDSSKLINLGSNRWTFRPQVGISRAVGKWTFEGAASVWLFGDNNDFFGGNELSQERIYVAKGHLIYSFNPGVWFGFGFGYARGGTTRINGEIRNTLQTNYRFGGTLAYAVAAQHGLSLSIASGVTTRVGADFDSFGVAYQYLW